MAHNVLDNWRFSGCD